MTPYRQQQLIELPVYVRALVAERLNEAQTDAYAEGRKDEREASAFLLQALQDIADMTYDSWTNGAKAGDIAIATLAKWARDA